MGYFLYRIFTSCILILGALLSPLILLFGKRYRAGFLQRLSFYPASLIESVKNSRPIWIHAASVGEVLAAVPLSRELKAHSPERPILISTFSLTGHEIAVKTAADWRIFLPLDHAWIVRRALRAFKPRLLIVLETEIWPNLLREASRTGIPTLLLSGRLSARSLRRYRLLRGFFARTLRCINAFGMQTREDAQRIIAIGAPKERVTVAGNLKHAAAPPLRRSNNNKDHNDAPVLIAGSSHDGEEKILLEVFASLKPRFPNLRLVLAPRHPQRFAEVEDLVRATGVVFDKKSAVNGKISCDKPIMLVDTIGDLMDFYAIADIAFVGGSLVEGGGHNPLEPARLGKPVLFGPFMSNFHELAVEMKQRGAAIEVKDAASLRRTVAELLDDSDRRERVGRLAYELATDGRGVLPATMALAERYLQ